MLFVIGYHQVNAQDVLSQYIEQGMENNLVLQQRNVSFERATYSLQIAKNAYLPTVNLQAGYQTADGGRNIPLPVGDLLNPVYRTLNQLTQPNNFPEIQNETINFLPRNYYDVHIRATMPLINTDIGHNKQIQEQQVRMSALEVDTYKRELIKEIKVAYFNYLSALQVVDTYRTALTLANEGKRSNERLLENGKGLPAYVLRSDSEVAAAEAKLTEALLNSRNAQLYFNALLNRQEDAEIDTAFSKEEALQAIVAVLQRSPATPTEREELASLNAAIGIRETALKMNKQYAVPKVNAFLDLGSQSEGFHFNDETRYYLAGLQLEFPIFNGSRNKIKIRQAKLDLQDAQLRLREVQRELQLAGSVAYHNLQSAWQNYQSAESQFVAAEAYQRLITRGYQAGSNSYIETVDARNQYTSARIARLVGLYRALSAAAALEREQATYPLTK